MVCVFCPQLGIHGHSIVQAAALLAQLTAIATATGVDTVHTLAGSGRVGIAALNAVSRYAAVADVPAGRVTGSQVTAEHARILTSVAPTLAVDPAKLAATTKYVCVV